MLKADDDSVLFSVLRAFLEGRNHPFQHLIELVPFRHFSSGENPDHGCAQLLRGHGPILHQLNVTSAAGCVREREVVSNAGTADSDAVQVCSLFELVDVLVARDVRVARKVVAGGVDAVDVM